MIPPFKNMRRRQTDDLSEPDPGAQKSRPEAAMTSLFVIPEESRKSNANIDFCPPEVNGNSFLPTPVFKLNRLRLLCAP
jgi:hypothetical protein